MQQYPRFHLFITLAIDLNHSFHLSMNKYFITRYIWCEMRIVYLLEICYWVEEITLIICTIKSAKRFRASCCIWTEFLSPLKINKFRSNTSFTYIYKLIQLGAYIFRLLVFDWMIADGNYFISVSWIYIISRKNICLQGKVE